MARAGEKQYGMTHHLPMYVGARETQDDLCNLICMVKLFLRTNTCLI